MFRDDASAIVFAELLTPIEYKRTRADSYGVLCQTTRTRSSASAISPIKCARILFYMCVYTSKVHDGRRESTLLCGAAGIGLPITVGALLKLWANGVRENAVCIVYYSI